MIDQRMIDASQQQGGRFSLGARVALLLTLVLFGWIVLSVAAKVGGLIIDAVVGAFFG